MLREIISTFTRMKPYSFVGEVSVCNLCGSSEHTMIGRRDRYGNRLRTVLCGTCGLIFTNPVPTEAEVTAYYSKAYRRHYHGAFMPRKKAVMRGNRGAISRHAFIESILKNGDRVLDVGAGAGEFVNFMCKKGYDAHGIEPNQAFAAYAAQTYGISVQAAMWQTAAVDEESFDVITANHCVEHFCNPLAAMKKFRSWLKKDGKLYLSVPNAYSPHRTPYARFHFGHIYNFTYETLIMMAKRAGLEQSEATPENSTTLIFEKVEPREDFLTFPDHSSDMKVYFDTYTNLRYFFSGKPYVRWIQRVRRLGGDMVKATVSK